jgi:hypothetical protein
MSSVNLHCFFVSATQTLVRQVVRPLSTTAARPHWKNISDAEKKNDWSDISDRAANIMLMKEIASG